MAYLTQLQQLINKRDKLFWIKLATAGLSLLIMITLINQARFWFTEDGVTVVTKKTPAHNQAAQSVPGLPQVIAWQLFGQSKNSAIRAVKPADLTINGIFLTNLASASTVVITQKGQKEKTYAVGDSLPGMGTIDAIQQDRVILRQNGELKALLLSMDGLGVITITKQTQPTKAKTTRRESNFEKYKERFKSLRERYPGFKDGSMKSFSPRGNIDLSSDLEDD